MKRTAICMVTVGLLLSMGGPVRGQDETAVSEAALKQDVVVLATSDVHCGISQGFGYAGLHAIEQTLNANGDYTLLVDDGDSVQGEPIGTMTNGEAIISLMNQVGYDVAIPGNHEFDYGMDQFFHLTEMADFPYISCNFNKEGQLVLDPYVIKEVDGIQIAFVGVTTPKTLTASTPAYFQDESGKFIYGFLQDETGEKVYEAVQKAADDARAAGADYVFLMGHLGEETSCEPWTYENVVSHTTGIDIVFDGHSHDTDLVTMKNADGKDVTRIGAGTKLNEIGYVRISAEDLSLSCGQYTWPNEDAAPALLGFTNEVGKAVDAANSKLDETLQTVVAKTSVDLIINDPTAVAEDGTPVRIIRNAETNLGDLCADAYRDQGQADIAFVNGGGIREQIPAGDITLGQILSVHPFGNSLCVAEVTGQQILDALEWGSRTCPEENGGFLQVSGLTYEIHTSVASTCTEDENGLFTGVAGGRRVQNVMVGGEKLDPARTYTLAGHNYMLKDQGDGYTMFKDCSFIQDETKLDNQVLKDYITGTLGGVVGEQYADPYGDGRIIAVEDEASTEGGAAAVSATEKPAA